MSNNTRSLRNRSSRFSSPATFTAVNQESAPQVHEDDAVQKASGNGADRLSQSQVQQGPWVEPVVRNGVASFEDTKGLERVGVLEHMQPLGAAPNPKLLQRLKISLGNRASLGSARATPVFSEGIASPASQPAELVKQDIQSPVIDPELLDPQSPPLIATHPQSQSILHPHPLSLPQYSAGSFTPVQSVPVPQPQLISPTSQSFSHLPHNQYTPASPFSSMPTHPDPVAPSYVQQHSPHIIMSPPRGRPAKREVEEMRAYNPDDSMMSPALTSTMRPSRASPRYNSSFSEHNRGDRFSTALQHAIDRATAEGKTEIKAGLERVLRESTRDELVTALDNISRYKANVSINQFKVFKHFVKKGIRKHRKTSSRSSILTNDNQGPSASNPQPAAYVSTFRSKRLTPPPTSLSNGNQNRHHSLRTAGYATAENNPPELLSDLPSPGVQRDVDANDPGIQIGKSRLPKSRSDSTSSLSSLDSNKLSNYTPPEMDVAPTKEVGLGRSTRPNAPRQASGRTVTGRSTRLSGIGTDSSSQAKLSASQPTANYQGVLDQNSRSKKHKLVDVDPAIEEEIARQKAKFEKDIVRDLVYEKRESFSRTPSPARKVRQAREEQQRQQRGLSPRPHRQRTGPPPPVIHPETLTQSTNIEPSSPVSAQGDVPPVNGDNRKRDYDEFAHDDQSDQLSSLGSTPPPPTKRQVTARNSVGAPSTRSSTPRPAKELNRSSRSRRTRMVETSPRKKSGTTGTHPNVSRAGADQDPAVTNGEDEKMLDDSGSHETCYACGEHGELIICDGCEKVFHGTCVEPPYYPEDHDENEPWFCSECEKKGSPLTHSDNKLMGPLIHQVMTTVPKAYALPSDVRNYFEYVKTGDGGEYVEVPPPPTNKRGAPKADHHGALKIPNFKELKDAKGNTRFCYKCNGTTEGTRDLIPCDYCLYEWHLDCLDPPLAVPPRRMDVNGKPAQNWRCPLHADQDFKNFANAQHAVPGQMGRQPRLRYPRKHVSTTPKEFLIQHPTNNGLIDPVLEPEEVPLDYKTVEMHGSVYKIPEHEIKLDFIAKARRTFYMDHAIPLHNGQRPHKFHSGAWTPDHAQLRSGRSRHDGAVLGAADLGTVVMRMPSPTIAHGRLRQKSFVEQQTVLALVDLAEGAKQDSTSMTDLIDRLVADAPQEVTEQINLSEQQQLERLAMLLQQRIDVLKKRSTRSTEEMDFLTQAKATKQVANSKLNGSVQQPQVNGALGHDHGDD